jgi:chromosome segregation ATPase
MDTPAPQNSPKAPENREVSALRSALEQAAIVVKRTESELATEKARATQHLSDALREKARAAKLQTELDNERARLAKLECAFVQSQQAQNELEAKVRAGIRDVVSTSSQGMAAAIKIEKLENEHRRLRQVIVNLTNERDELRNEATGKKKFLQEVQRAPEKPAAKGEFIGPAGPQTMAMAMSLECDTTERVERRGRFIR